MDTFKELSFSFAMDLFFAKEKASKRNDQQALHSLKTSYPMVFSKEFEDFIFGVKCVVEYIKQQNHIGFGSAETLKKDKTFH